MARESLREKIGFTRQFKRYERNVGEKSRLVVDNRLNFLMRKSVKRLYAETTAQIEAMTDEERPQAYAEAAEIFSDLGDRSGSRWVRRGFGTGVATSGVLLAASPYLAAGVAIVTGTRTFTEMIRSRWFNEVSENFTELARSEEIYPGPVRNTISGHRVRAAA